jgi:transcriptional regulator with XRE-family HTH domain
VTDPDAHYAGELGRRLRAARLRRDLSLSDVHERSGGRWTPGTLGAYERGIRRLKVSRLVDLAELYDVPVTLLLPHSRGREELPGPGVLAVDLARLRRLPLTRTGPLRRWITIVQALRDDSARDVIRLRRADAPVIARLYSTTPVVLVERLAAWGTLAAADGDDAHGPAAGTPLAGRLPAGPGVTAGRDARRGVQRSAAAAARGQRGAVSRPGRAADPAR